MASPEFYEKVSEVLAPRCAGGLAEVRALGSPFGEGSLVRWVAAGLLGTPAAERLKVLADMDAVALEAIEAVLSVGPEFSGSGDWEWDSYTDTAWGRVALGIDSGPGISDDDTLFDTGIVEPGDGPALVGRARFDLGDRPVARTRFVDVHLARDLLLGRDVAVHLRSPRCPLAADAFVEAIRRQAALQFPNIPPIYELAEAPGEELARPVPFFATSIPLADTLEVAIKDRARGGQAARARWRTQSLLEALLDVARSVAFAHRGGVVHRDLRPAHVRLGQFGEVLLGGWFRARRWADPLDAEQDERLEAVGGGLGYLAPERLLRGINGVDASADVWGLGALLYAVLTDRPPFVGASSSEVMAQIRAGELEAPGALRAGVSLTLEDLCLRALVIEPDGRRLAADDFAAELEDYLEGNRAEARRIERARALLAEAEAAAARYREARARAHALWEPGRPGPEYAALEAARRERWRWFATADEVFIRAQAALPGHNRARHGQAVLYAEATQDARREGAAVHAFLEAGLAQIEASLPAPIIASAARLEIRSEPADAVVTVHQYVEADGVLQPDAGRQVGHTPLALAELRPGGYQLRLVAPGRPPVVVAVALERGERLVLDVDLPAAVPPGAIYVPAGPCRVGSGLDGDRAAGALSPGRATLPAFVMQQIPVTLGAWRRFLDAVHAEDPERAARFAPRRFVGAPPLWTPGKDGYRLPFATPDGGAWTAQMPVVGVGVEAASAYASWLAERDGVPWRLPTELEWEKAARGSGGRRYPWGERPEPAFCHHRGAARRTSPPPVGTARQDVSMYGVQDLAGTAREITIGVDKRPILRGGSWLLPFTECAAVTRAPLTPATPLLAVGLRLAADAGPGDRAPVVEPLFDWPVASPPEDEASASLGGDYQSEEITVEGRTLFLGLPAGGGSNQPGTSGPFDNSPRRYELHEEIARGSMGRVMLAWDAVLRRHVALKILHDRHRADPLSRYRFTMEARITGRLQHPVMLPIYDLGVLPDGRRYFAMRPVEGQSLRDVLQARKLGDEWARRDFGRDRLLTIVRRICQGVAFAHAHQVVHRDLKPANVLIGAHGEVALADLGLARQMAPDSSDMDDVAEARQLAQADGRVTRVGSVIGTPYYMSPEQAMGLQDLVGPSADVYGLGAILYHVLAQQPPFGGTKINEVLAKVRRGNPRPPSEVAAGVPAALDRIVLEALSMDPGRRPGSAMALAEALHTYQESTRLAEAHAEWAAGRAAQARAALTSCADTARQVDSLSAQLAPLEEEMRGADPIEQRRVVHRARAQIVHAMARFDAMVAVALHHGRLALAGSDFSVAEGLADLLVDRCRRARNAGDAVGRRVFERLLGAVDARRAADLDVGAALIIRAEPRDATLTVVHVAEPEAEVIFRGRAPLRLPSAPAGAGHVIGVAAAARVVVPFVVRRGEPVRLTVPCSPVPEGFVRVAAGAFVYGATRPGDDAPPARVARLDDFLIAQRPITCGEWHAFLTDLAQAAPEEATARRPRIWAGGPRLWGPRAHAAFGVFAPDRPITGVTLADAQAYARWRGARDGRSYRLPANAEWEKAARGVDGRGWPWGDYPDPTRTARVAHPLPPVGHDPADVSIYGMADVISGAFEWTQTRADAGRCYVRGHCSALPLSGRPCASRLVRDPRRPSPLVGFRLVLGAPVDGRGSGSTPPAEVR